MPEETESVHNGATPRHGDATLKRWLGSASIVALGLIAGGFVLGDGLVRMKAAERSVTVRGLAEREVTADLATWTVSFASTATNLQTAQANTDRDAEAVRAFFEELGFPEEELTPAGINVSSYTNDGTVFYTVRQRTVLRTRDIDRAQRAVRDAEFPERVGRLGHARPDRLHLPRGRFRRRLEAAHLADGRVAGGRETLRVARDRDVDLRDFSQDRTPSEACRPRRRPSVR